MSEKTHEFRYEEFKLKSILSSHFRSIRFRDKAKIEDFEYWIDPVKEEVVVKFWVELPSEEERASFHHETEE